MVQSTTNGLDSCAVDLVLCSKFRDLPLIILCRVTLLDFRLFRSRELLQASCSYTLHVPCMLQDVVRLWFDFWALYILAMVANVGWLGSRVVSVLDSGTEGLGSNRSRDAVG